MKTRNKKAGPLGMDTGQDSENPSNGRRIGMQARSPQFGSIPFWIIAKGLVAMITPHQSKVLLVICAHVNGRRWSCKVTDARIARVAGVSARTVQRATKRFVALRICSVQRGNGPGRATQYQFYPNGDTIVSPILATKDDTMVSSNPETMGDAPELGRVTPVSKMGDKPASPQQNGTDKKQQSAAAKCNSIAEGKLRALFKTEGIGPPTIDELVSNGARAELTVEQARKALGELTKSAGAGLKVKRLREESESLNEQIDAQERLVQIVVQLGREHEGVREKVEEWFARTPKYERDEPERAAKRAMLKQLGESDAAMLVVNEWFRQAVLNGNVPAWRFLVYIHRDANN